MNKKLLVMLIGASSVLLACEQAQQNVQSTTEKTMQQVILHQAVQADVDNIAANLDIKYQVVTNIPSQKCDKNIENGLCFEVKLSFTAKKDIQAKDWNIHFSQILPAQSFDSKEFAIEHVNGDLHKLSLNEHYKGFKQGETKTLVFRSVFWSLSEWDAMPNYIVSANNSEAKVIESTRPQIDAATGLETLPYVVPFTDYEKQFKRTAADSTQWLNSELLFTRNQKLGTKTLDVKNVIIPTPKSVTYDQNNTELDVAAGLKVNFGNVEPSLVAVALKRLADFGLKSSEQGIALNLSVVKNNDKPIGSYQLTITSAAISVQGVDANGVFNGLQSLASLVTLGSSKLPLLTAIDEPHFAFRGLLIDVARNFHSKTFILNMLEQMAAYKLNKLHLHLGDDEGWRLEIPSLPELTELGSKRCFDMNDGQCLVSQLGAGVDNTSEVNGFYTVADYQEILKAATARHIQVIPSLDMPGHSRAAIKAMAARSKKYSIAEQGDKAQQFNLYDKDDPTVYSSVQYYNDNTINVCLESSYAFVTEVMTQVKQIHADAGQPLTRYHIGADETAGAWIESQACKEFIANNDKGVKEMSELGAYFIERVAGILSDLNIETAGWSDGLEHTRKENMPAIVQSNAWDALFWNGQNKVHQLANRDWQVVISSPDVLYFDFPYEADPKEPGYYWASRHTNTEKVFQFMPDNLPVHAEFWLDREDNAYTTDDTKTPLDANRKFLGIQGQLWSENTRNDNMAEYKVFPRLYALAERSWHLADWAVPYNYQGAKYGKETNAFSADLREKRDLSWQLFANALGQKELRKLEKFDIGYRLPTVGGVIKNGLLHANIAFPGIVIEYQDNSGQWVTYKEPNKVLGDVSIRSRSYDGQRTGRITKIRQSK
ncbi:MAG: hexosaminidase [Alteromonadaceae bacterium]|jgi:hexosaminidase